MSIGIGSKWVKDGEIVEVKDTRFNECFIYGETCVWFITPTNPDNLHVLTLSDFLEQYKHYEPVYEWQWAFKRKTDTKWTISDTHWIGIPCLTPDEADYQRLDFTKRERKQ